MKWLADELISGMRKRLPDLLGSDGQGVWSVCVCGSYVRGDFIERNSDLDFNIIFQPGSDRRKIHDPAFTPGYQAIRDLVVSLLNGRRLYSHNPNQFDWITVSWESIPKRVHEVHIPRGRPHLPLFHIFLFDYVENLQVLWGDDPRVLIPDLPDFSMLAKQWFENVPLAHQRYRREGNEWRIPFSAFKSLQVAQIVFGERTLDKRHLLELYKAHVPDFPLKEFGCRMIRDKMCQRYPDHPCTFAPYPEYVDLENQLAEVVREELTRRLDRRYP